jgi:hypothetical protein
MPCCHEIGKGSIKKTAAQMKEKQKRFKISSDTLQNTGGKMKRSKIKKDG